MARKACVSIYKEERFICKTSCSTMFVVADYGKFMKANVVTIFQIVVPAHQGRPHVALSKLIHIAIRVIKFKALQLFGT